MRFKSEEGKQGKIRGNVDKINRESVKFIKITRFFHMEEIFRLAALAMSFIADVTVKRVMFFHLYIICVRTSDRPSS